MYDFCNNNSILHLSVADIPFSFETANVLCANNLTNKFGFKCLFMLNVGCRMEESKSESASGAAALTNSKKKREDKIRRRDSKALENVFKTINSLSDAEKFQSLSVKYSELYEEYRGVQQNLTLVKKNCDLLEKEKDQVQNEYSKCLLARSRMESLCRELQKQNKIIKDENTVKIREEEERRKIVADKFQTTLNDLTGMMQENNEKNFKLRNDNLDMANKIASLCDQFEKREEQLGRMERQMELEKQISDAKLAKGKFEMQAERELWTKEREILQSNLKKSEEDRTRLQTNMQTMEQHLALYTGKYEEFESTINQSNKVFDNCKNEVLKMSKQIQRLEKEAKTWKLRWQKNTHAVVELSESKQAQDRVLAASERKIEQLQKLCRQLQIDRAAFLKLLKSHNIEATSQMCENPPPSPQTKPTKKEQELEVLKNNLKVLQEQLNGVQIDVKGDQVELNGESACAEEEKVDAEQVKD